jgi:hypothetical protein
MSSYGVSRVRRHCPFSPEFPIVSSVDEQAPGHQFLGADRLGGVQPFRRSWLAGVWARQQPAGAVLRRGGRHALEQMAAAGAELIRPIS